MGWNPVEARPFIITHSFTKKQKDFDRILADLVAPITGLKYQCKPKNSWQWFRWLRRGCCSFHLITIFSFWVWFQLAKKVPWPSQADILSITFWLLQLKPMMLKQSYNFNLFSITLSVRMPCLSVIWLTWCSLCLLKGAWQANCQAPFQFVSLPLAQQTKLNKKENKIVYRWGG